VQIAMDDFGTGYSSLAYLRSFPFDKIKIDRSFIQDLANGAEPYAIVRAVTGLANNLSIISTAEGVETQQQLDTLHDVGCTEMQGYFFSKARPARRGRRVVPAREEKAGRRGLTLLSAFFCFRNFRLLSAFATSAFAAPQQSANRRLFTQNFCFF
jgi:EAL domain-containing protein (putative c-di-GMP-specific phosphodiesterase class I)